MARENRAIDIQRVEKSTQVTKLHVEIVAAAGLRGGATSAGRQRQDAVAVTERRCNVGEDMAGLASAGYEYKRVTLAAPLEILQPYRFDADRLGDRRSAGSRNCGQRDRHIQEERAI